MSLNRKELTEEEKKKIKEKFIELFKQSRCFIVMCDCENIPDRETGGYYFMSNATDREVYNLLMLIEDNFPDMMRQYMMELIKINTDKIIASVQAQQMTKEKGHHDA